MVAMVKEENDAALIIIQQSANWSTIRTILKGRLTKLQRLLFFPFICCLRKHLSKKNNNFKFTSRLRIVTLSVCILHSHLHFPGRQ